MGDRHAAFCYLVLLLLVGWAAVSDAAYAPLRTRPRNAYATMIYMGTPRDYEFYVAARVMLRSLARLNVDADRVVIASNDVPSKWISTLRMENVTVLVVENIDNPYKNQPRFDRRFTLTLNKLYAWTLTDYDRVVMLDADNLFLRAPDELFLCGNFCAAFINPCIFHTGLFVLEPSMDTFNDMMKELTTGRPNVDGADQGFLTSYFGDLLGAPLFTPPTDGKMLRGHFRLPLGYQMDASYFYLKLKWSVPCGMNSVITFPSVPLLKPWYWWSWPILPLGLEWHTRRSQTIGYGSDSPYIIGEAIFALVTLMIAIVIRRRNPSCEKPPLKSCLGRGPCSDQSSSCHPLVLKALLLAAIVASFVLPYYAIPTTVHPLMGWGILLLGSLASLSVVLCVFPALPILSLLGPWFCGIGALLVLAFPFYSNGITRALAILVYSFLASPFFWKSLSDVFRTVDLIPDREPLMGWTAVRTEPQSELMKLC